MSQNDDPFQEEDVKKPENEKNLSESFDLDPATDEDDDIIDLLDYSEEQDDGEILELKDMVDEDKDIIELTPEAEAITDEDILELADEADIVPGEDEDILELADEADVVTGEDEDILELADEAGITADKDGYTPAEPTDQAGVEVDEDKQILELIDDIQSTLDQTKETETEDLGDETDQTPLTDDAEEAIDKEESLEGSVILGDDETLETEDLSESESEFVDHLGLDLTSEFSKEMFREDSETSALLTEKIEEAVERVIHRMLSDKDSLLVQAIIKAAKKEIE